MSWIALKMLVGDRAKFLGIVMGLTFAALLIMQQGSIFCGLMCRTAGQIADISGADLWVMDPNVAYIDDGKPMLESNLYRVRGVQGVLLGRPPVQGEREGQAHDLPARRDERVPGQRGRDPFGTGGHLAGGCAANRAGGQLRRPPRAGCGDDRSRGAAQAVPGRGLGQAGCRPELGDVEEFAREGSYYHPKLKKWFELSHIVGCEMEMNDRRAVVVGICEATRTFQSNAVLYTTYTRAKQFIPQERKPLTFILAKADSDDPAECARVAKAIKAETGLLAQTSSQFWWATLNYYAQYTGIPINFGITTVLGFLVGTAIAGQTFYNFTLENLKQFGSLKAMGATNLRIVGMILLQATVVGLLGYGLGVGLASAFGMSVRGEGIGVLHAVAAPAAHRRGNRADLHPFQPAEHPARGRAGTGRGLPGLIPLTFSGEEWR